MKIEDLKVLRTLPLATSNQEVDERVLSIIEFHQSNSDTSIHLVAEAIVSALFYVSYSQHVSNHVEPVLLQWIDKYFNEKNNEYMDAVSTIYANMCTLPAHEHLVNKINSVTNLMAKKYLNEALNEFELQT